MRAAKLGAMRILIVEDNPDVGVTLRMVLQALGHEIRHVHDAETALDVVPAFKPEVIVLDLGLPGMTGHEVAIPLRKASGEGLMIVALTGWGRDEDRERSRQAGIDYHLVKPLNLEVLKEVLKRHPANCT
jgi:DNA-binding response OmpR family regulator